MHSDYSQPDSAVLEAQKWDELRQMLQDAGVPLSPEQEARWQQANELLKARLEPFQAVPICLFLRFFLMAILPQIALELVGGALLGDEILDYFKTITQILTPEQRQIWERSFNRDQ